VALFSNTEKNPDLFRQHDRMKLILAEIMRELKFPGYKVSGKIIVTME